jgi:endonuclease G
MRKLLILFLFPPLLVFTQELKDFSKDTVEDLKWGYEYFMPTSTCGEIIKYNNFSVSFCEEYRLSEWAIYYKDAYPSEYVYSRKGLNFKKDPNLNGRDGGNIWYYKNIYDKGHLVPAMHMSDNDESLKETFLFTNCTPQHESLNRGVMRELEKKMKQWNNEFGRVAIITGWIVEESLDLMYNGPPPYMPIPKYYYKVFVDISNNRSIAFLIPNKKSTNSLMEYVVSIDYLESVTGLDFFYKLPDDLELSYEIDTGIELIKKQK